MCSLLAVGWDFYGCTSLISTLFYFSSIYILSVWPLTVASNYYLLACILGFCVVDKLRIINFLFYVCRSYIGNILIEVIYLCVC